MAAFSPRATLPRYCVWETTLACNLACRHCGSSAGGVRDNELDTAEALDLMDQLAALGTTELTLSGGEFLVRPDWHTLLAHGRARGLQQLIISNGLTISPAVAADIAREQVQTVSISIDGPPELHNWLRPIRPAAHLDLSDPDAPSGSFAQIVAAIRNLQRAGVTVAAITQVSNNNLHALDDILALLLEHHIKHWQVQITHPMGRVAGAGVQPIQPSALPVLYTFIRGVQRSGRIRCLAADDIGYYGADEHLLRSSCERGDRFWTGCHAGLQLLGITSDGHVRGCLSMPAALAEGNIRQRSLRDIWEDPAAFSYNRRFERSSLTGACGTCTYGNLCRAGCHSSSYTALGHMNENPYCIRHFKET